MRVLNVSLWVTLIGMFVGGCGDTKRATVVSAPGSAGVISSTSSAPVGSSSPPGGSSSTPGGPKSTTNDLLLVVGPDSNSVSQIFRVRTDGSDRQQLTVGADNKFFPAWSPDYQRILFTAEGDLWLMDADGSRPTQLTFSPNGPNFVASFSPDSTQITFTSTRSGKPEIWVMDADGGNQRQLTSTSGSSTTRNGNVITWGILSAFSPDGQKIAYGSTESGRSQVWVMDADGTNPVQLTTAGLADYPDANAPSWSPDGNRIAFWSGFETEFGDIFSMNPDGSDRTQLTFEAVGNSGINSDGPAWSPDGSRIMFETNRIAGAGTETWVMNADGSVPRLLLPYPAGAGRRPW